MSAVSTALVTGANRGLGLAFVRALLERGWRVLAACRAPEQATELAALEDDVEQRLQRVALDLAAPSDVARCAQEVAAQVPALDLLINNAGMVDAPLDQGDPDPEQFLRVLRVNTVAPLQLAHALRTPLAAATRPVVACLSSRIGALREGAAPAAGSYGYAASKAALHRSIPILAANLRADSIIALGLDPGWVATGMTAGDTGRRYQLTPERSVAGMLAVLADLGPEDSGRLLRWNGEACRWAGPPESAEELQLRA